MQEIYLISRSHSIGRSTWHIEWCTKYRYKMMQQFGNRNIVKACIRQAAHKHEIKILVLEALPEHVHMVVELRHGMSIDKAVNLLKGYSAWKIFHARERFRPRYPKGHFWSRGYMARTVGVDEERAIRYVLEQQRHHCIA